MRAVARSYAALGAFARSIAAVSLMTASCGDDDGSTASPDAGRDAGDVLDARPPDLGSRDLGSPDTGALDSGPPDLGPPDLGPPDLGPPDLGPLDLGPLDGGLDPTACDDLFTASIFCDGFEEGLDRWTSVWGGAEGSIAIDTTRAFRGAAALRARTTERTATLHAQADVLGGLTSGELYLRAWFLFPDGAALTTAYLLSANEATTPYQGLTVGFWGSSTANAQLGTASHAYTAETRVPPVLGRWTCVEAHLTIDDVAGALEVRVDDTLVISESGIDTRPAAGFTRLAVGITGVEAGHPPTEVLVDEVVADTRPIGCTE